MQINQKPPIGAQINWSHPLAQGLVGCWLFNEGSGTVVINSVSGVMGNVISGNISNDVNITTASGTILTNTRRVGDYNNPQVTLTVIAKRAAGGTTTWCPINEGQNRFRISIDGTTGVLGGGIDQAWNVANPAGFIAQRDVWNTMSLSYNKFSLVFGLNGNTCSIAESRTQYTASTTELFFNGEYLPTNRFYGAISSYRLGLLHARALSLSEIASITNNPYQIFKPELGIKPYLPRISYGSVNRR